MTGFDEGLLSPATAGHDELVSDAFVLDALIRAECALAGAYADIGVAPREVDHGIAHAFGFDEKYGSKAIGLDAPSLPVAAVAGGNPVIPLVGRMKAQVIDELRLWVHRGATSQDILDTALMIVAQRAVQQVRASLGHSADWLRRLADAHRGDVVAARTLTQHAVPTTVGQRLTVWAHGLERARARLAALELPAQLAGAGGTLASFVEITGSPAAATNLVAAYARRLDLAVPDAPWHVTRWPVTELGDALVQALDAMGKLAADVATLSRTEIGEVAEGVGGGSSAMPQKQNPAEAVLIRSAAIRAPQLGATLHLASALAVDERPDGAWHAEWPTLRELLRLALGASWHSSSLAAHLRIDAEAGARNLALTRGLILSERLGIVLIPLIGKGRFDQLIAEASGGAELEALVRALPEASALDIDALLDAAQYTGLAGVPVREAAGGEAAGEEPA